MRVRFSENLGESQIQSESLSECMIANLGESRVRIRVRVRLRVSV